MSRAGGPSGESAGRGREGRMVVDGNTGEIMRDQDQGIRPVGERLRERISRTRGGRVLLGVSRVAWHSTVGAPAAWTRMRRRASDLTVETNRQLDHYTKVRQSWGRDSRDGRRDLSQPLRRGYGRAMAPLNRAQRLQQFLAGPKLPPPMPASPPRPAAPPKPTRPPGGAGGTPPRSTGGGRP